MPADRFDIYFNGELLPDHPPDEVRAALARLFRADEAKLDRLFSGVPVRIKRDVDADTATRYRAKLRAVGALIDIKPRRTSPNAAANHAPSRPAAPSPPAPEESVPATARFELPDGPATCPARFEVPDEPDTGPARFEVPDEPDAGPARFDVPDEPAVAAARFGASDATGLELLPARTGSLEDCAPPPAPPPAVQIEGMSLADAGQVLDHRPAPTPAEILTDHLSAAPANTGSLEDCVAEKKPAPIPTISHLQLVDN